MRHRRPRSLAPKRPRHVTDGVIWHDQTVQHAFLEMLDHSRLASRDQDRQHIAISRPEFDNVSAVVFRTEYHDAVFTYHRRRALARDALLERADLLISFGKKLAVVFHRHRSPGWSA